MASWGDYQRVYIIGASPAGVLTSQNLLEAVLVLQPRVVGFRKNFSNHRAGLKTKNEGVEKRHSHL